MKPASKKSAHEEASRMSDDALRPWIVDEEADLAYGDMIHQLEQTLTICSPCKEGQGQSYIDLPLPEGAASPVLQVPPPSRTTRKNSNDNNSNTLSRSRSKTRTSSGSGSIAEDIDVVELLHTLRSYERPESGIEVEEEDDRDIMAAAAAAAAAAVAESDDELVAQQEEEHVEAEAEDEDDVAGEGEAHTTLPLLPSQERLNVWEEASALLNASESPLLLSSRCATPQVAPFSSNVDDVLGARADTGATIRLERLQHKNNNNRKGHKRGLSRSASASSQKQRLHRNVLRRKQQGQQQQHQPQLQQRNGHKRHNRLQPLMSARSEADLQEDVESVRALPLHNKQGELLLSAQPPASMQMNEAGTGVGDEEQQKQQLEQQQQRRKRSSPAQPKMGQAPSERKFTVGKALVEEEDNDEEPKAPAAAALSHSLSRARPTTASSCGASARRRRDIPRSSRPSTGTPQSKSATLTRRAKIHYRNGPYYETVIKADDMFVAARNAIKESKRVNSMDHTWKLLTAKDVSASRECDLWRTQQQRIMVYTDDYADTVEQAPIFPEYCIKMDGLRRWTESAIRDRWKMWDSGTFPRNPSAL